MNTPNQNNTILFPLGNCYMTPGIAEVMERHQLCVEPFLARHQCGDWGELSAEDQAENELSLKEGFRILSSYSFIPNQNVSIKFWIITEADRSSTTILLPEEY